MKVGKCPGESKLGKGEGGVQPAGEQGPVWGSAGQPAVERAEGPAKAGGPSRTEVFVPLARGDVSATEAQEETRCPHDTGASLPPCTLRTGPVVSQPCPAPSSTQPTCHCPMAEGQHLPSQAWAPRLAFLLHPNQGFSQHHSHLHSTLAYLQSWPPINLL